MFPTALTIAGSDSSGGAGVQADLRTFAFHCVHGASVLTCVTAQNTLRVTKVEPISVAMIIGQIEAVMGDLTVKAVKTGMLLNSEIIEVVAEQLAKRNVRQLVVDPVMVSRTGAQLIDDRAIANLQARLLPQALITTPNLYEAEILSGIKINTVEEMKQAAAIIHEKYGVAVVLVKGGGMSGQDRGVDVWFDGKSYQILTTTIVETKNTHGTGCTLSSAIAANLALGKDLWLAVQEAKTYVTTALKYSLEIGAGSGPVGHFFPLLKEQL
ncbi:MAG: bifunctional hydroxymethylpyrimidine kinase/phosphomethylpyrimidine kinase [Xenococcaceae cyanobacterium MO_188.B32]|nr:bifunctional hydroxymethylpyrimidine kinase/phosphomethylpyrimidine kinase [Xenococcaceae cyanobacterium MO_188.B32]